MEIKYVHTNIISNDWQKLVDFYVNVFGCIPMPPERNLEGEWLESGTAVKGAKLKGMHLKLPGCGDNGPTLEIFQYSEMVEQNKPTANRKGFGHIAFHVEDVETILEKMITFGGSKLGEVVKKEFKNGALIFTYARDPEGNIIELQKWESK